MDIIVHQIVSVDMSPERAEAFLRFCKYETLYEQLGADLLNLKPEDIKNGWIKIIFTENQKLRLQRFDEA